MRDFFLDFLDNPLFGLVLTIGTLILFLRLFRGKRNPLLNPMVFSIAAIILFLELTGIPYETYAKGGDIISFFLGPVTVALAIPLYKQYNKLKADAAPIFVGITVGSAVAIISTIGLGLLMNLNFNMLMSLAPKATTSAIAMDISSSLGGDPALTVTFVVLAGSTGFMFGESIFNLLGIKHRTSKGLALGTASHAFGTNRALLMGEVEGAMSSLAIGVAGIITTLILPLLLNLFGL